MSTKDTAAPIDHWVKRGTVNKNFVVKEKLSIGILHMAKIKSE